MLAVFNWSDEPATVEVPLPAEATHVFDAWEQDYLGALSGRLSLDLPPHACRLFALRTARDSPQFIGSSLHLLQGAIELGRESWLESGLILPLKPVAVATGEVFFAAPPGSGKPSAEGSVVRHLADDVWALAVTVDEEHDLIVRFS
jgi:hypothetical protein